MFALPRRLLLAVVLIVPFAGCSKSAERPARAPAGSVSPPVATDQSRGQKIFSANCSQCHGSTGTEGGIGPSLRNEKSKKDLDATIAWIEHPAPPMPKLYPSPLSDKDVADVAAYVRSL